MTTMALAAPALVTHAPGAQHAGFILAPPMRPRLIDAGGHWRRPFVYPLQLSDRLSRIYGSRRPVQSQSGFSTPGGWWPSTLHCGSRSAPICLGAMCGRVSCTARVCPLGVASVATAAALLLGIMIGGLAGASGGGLDILLTRLADLVLALPALYVVVALRAALPLVLSTPVLFWTLSGVLALAGWPVVARGVRGIVAGERVLDTQKLRVRPARAVRGFCCAICFRRREASSPFRPRYSCRPSSSRRPHCLTSASDSRQSARVGA